MNTTSRNLMNRARAALAADAIDRRLFDEINMVLLENLYATQVEAELVKVGF